MDEPGLSLEAFMARAASGEWGRYGPGALVAFLREVERDLVAGIRTQAEANPAMAEEAGAREEEAHALIAELVARYGGQGSPASGRR